MLQQETPDDYVLATNETHTVREFAELSFREAGIEIAWRGSGVEEKGYDAQSGQMLVDVDPRYFRPAEVELFVGRCVKGRAGTRLAAQGVFADLRPHDDTSGYGAVRALRFPLKESVYAYCSAFRRLGETPLAAVE